MTASTLPATSERDLDSLEVTPSACNPDTRGEPSFSAAASAAATPPFLKDADVGREGMRRRPFSDLCTLRGLVLFSRKGR